MNHLYSRLDPTHILSLCWKIGVSASDQRVAELNEFVKNLQGDCGLWECDLHPQASRWLTFNLLSSLSKLKSERDWISLEL